VVLLPLLLGSAALPAAVVTPLSEGWRLQSACQVSAKGDVISGLGSAGAGFSAESWLKTAVPSTVLAAQVADQVFPDPYFGDNLRKIPGESYPVGRNFANLPMPEDSPYRCGWWYRKEFTAPAAEGRRFSLHFGGINYRAEIWLNGKKIADTSAIAGAYRIYDLDVTGQLEAGKPNVLAVETFAPTEKDLGITWVDWNPAPPDKDMGLWGAVEVEQTGPVTLRSPMATTHFSDSSLTRAEVTVTAELHNATDHAVKGVVSGSAAGANLEQTVELAAHEDRTVIFAPEKYRELEIHAPKVWWPYQMGTAHLERLTLKFTEDGKVSDEQSIEFGIREITSELTANGSRLFRINGKPLLIRGGGWAQDMLLRYDPKRVREQFRMVKDLNLNTIRLEGKLEPEEFFHLADREGILILPGWSCCDHWEQWKSWTAEDLAIAKASLKSQLTRLRSHPSVLGWLNGSDNAPPADVERAYLQIEAEIGWPNPVLSAASSANTGPSGLNGVKMTGPYDYVAPSYWYVDSKNGGAYGFNTETSPGPAIPSLASRRKFLTDPEAWPPTADWSLHFGGGEFANLKVFDEAMAAVYAEPHSAADFERMASALEYDSERAMFEAYSRNKYSSTGVIQWMLNNAWPSMIWHLYDYNLEAGAGYFAAKKACEPLHIQYSYDDHSIIVVNSTYAAVEGLHAAYHVHSLDWKELDKGESTLDSAADSSVRIGGVADALYAQAGRVLLIDMTLTNSEGKTVSRNFYWVPTTLTTFDFGRTDYTHTPAAQHENLSALTYLPQAQVEAGAEMETGSKEPEGKDRELSVLLENKSDALAFQVSLAARTASGELIAPVYWSDNWIELAPGESRTITAHFSPDVESDAKPVIQLSGWNIASQTLTPVAKSSAHAGAH
jgi:exo-1,4-beta-D-glucosaminidase